MLADSSGRVFPHEQVHLPSPSPLYRSQTPRDLGLWALAFCSAPQGLRPRI